MYKNRKDHPLYISFRLLIRAGFFKNFFKKKMATFFVHEF